MEFSEVIRKRYSVRKFDSRQVEPDKLEQLLETVRLAPTAVNKQPQRLLVIQTRPDMEKLAKCTKYTFDAPAAIIVASQDDAAWVRPYDGENSGIIDASIVTTYLMLAICDLDLGSCWVGHFDPQAVIREFNFPKGLRPVAVLPFGYPAADSRPSPYHDKSLPLSDLVWYGSF